MQDRLQLESMIFSGAAVLLADQRSNYLNQACGEDKALRQQLEALLRAREQSEGVLDEAVVPRGEIGQFHA